MANKIKPRMSDDDVESKTGKTWSRWFKHLDAAGGKKMTHQEIAAHLAGAGFATGETAPSPISNALAD